MIRAAILSLAITSPAIAGGYDANPVYLAFAKGPCSEVIGAIDDPDMTAAINKGPQAMAEVLAMQAGFFGFIVGFDAASGGLHDGDTTTLSRLREACASDPFATALSILEGL